MKKFSVLVTLSLIVLAACNGADKTSPATEKTKDLSPAKPLAAAPEKGEKPGLEDKLEAQTVQKEIQKNPPAVTRGTVTKEAAAKSATIVKETVGDAKEAASKAAAALKTDLSGNADNLAARMAQVKQKARQNVDADAVIKAIKETTNSVALIQLVTPLSYTTTRGPVVRGIFKDLLKHPDPDVREQTLMALEDYDGVAFMLDDMALMLEDEDEDVRDSAMTTIADYVENRAKYEVLVKALDSKYPDVVEEAMFNLGFYTDVDFPTVQEWKDWWAKNKDTFKVE